MRKQKKEFQSNLETLENRVFLSTMEVVPTQPPEPARGDGGYGILLLDTTSSSSAIGGDGADVLRGGAGNNDVDISQDGSDLLIVNNGDGSDFLEVGGDAVDDLQSNGDGSARTVNLNTKELVTIPLMDGDQPAVDALLSNGDIDTRDGQVPTEQFSLNFEQIKLDYNPEAVDEVLSNGDDGTRGDPHEKWILLDTTF